MTEWYDSMNTTWQECHSTYTDSFTTPWILANGSSTSQSPVEEVLFECDGNEQNTELDPQLGIILSKLLECADQDSLKTYLLDVEAYQNGKPIEEVVTQKAVLERLICLRN